MKKAIQLWLFICCLGLGQGRREDKWCPRFIQTWDIETIEIPDTKLASAYFTVAGYWYDHIRVLKKIHGPLMLDFQREEKTSTLEGKVITKGSLDLCEPVPQGEAGFWAQFTRELLGLPTEMTCPIRPGYIKTNKFIFGSKYERCWKISFANKINKDAVYKITLNVKDPQGIPLLQGSFETPEKS